MDYMHLIPVLHVPAVIWFLIALFFVLLELTAPALVAIFFAAGAFVLVPVLFLFPGTPLWLQIAVFLVVSLIALTSLRGRFARVFGGNRASEKGALDIDDDFVGRDCVVEMPVGPLPGGRVIMRGTEWSATAADVLEKGTACIIVKREGTAFVVKRAS